MPPRKPKRAPRKTKAESPFTMKRVVILLEDMQAQNRATIDAVHALGTRLDAKIDALRDELLRRIEALEVAVRLNSEAIRQNTADIRENSEDIRRILQKLDTFATAAELAQLERRVEALEKRAAVR